MQGSNRSGLQCLEHPNQEITNYCLHFDCLKPLCPDCVQLHTKYHQKQEIQSWKHCVNKSARNVKSTLDQLRGVYDRQNQYQSIKSVDQIQSQNVKRLHLIKEKVMKIVDDAFNVHEQRLRNVIRSQYKIDPPDTTKLRMAIQQLQKILMKLGHTTTVLPALKKSLLLDHQSLINYFGNLKSHEQWKIPTTQMFISENYDPARIRSSIDDIVRIHSAQYNHSHAHHQDQYFSSPNNLTPFQNRLQSPMRHSEGFTINHPNYFSNECRNKNLHFFIPVSRQLKLLNLQNTSESSRQNWKTVNFKSKHELPCFFKSIITPQGDIYLTGGSEDEKRFRQIYRYNYQKNSLDFVCKMIHDRSSHSICYLNRGIYLIGGFSNPDGDVTRQCQVFRLDTQSCQAIRPLNAPSANSCATSFNGQYILKFGGILNKLEGNNLIQMYNAKQNKWTVVNIDTSRSTPRIQFLSFSAGVQINKSEILVFGGYDNTEMQRPERTCYSVQVDTSRSVVHIKNYDYAPLPYAEGFWNNNPIVHNQKVYALQNITDQQDELTAIADQRRVLIFNGDRWS